MDIQITEFSSIIDLINQFPNEQSCIDQLEAIRWRGNVISPFDANSKVYKCKGNKYRCRNTGKYFNVRTGTIFEDTKLPLQKWFMAIYIMASHKKGISSHQLARDLKISQKSAWFVLHRIRYAFDHPSFKKDFGNGKTVEGDESYLGGKEKNRHKNKKKNVAGTATKSYGPTDDKKAVVGLVERQGNVIVQYMENPKINNVEKFIKSTVKTCNRIVTDEHYVYSNLNKYYNHATIQHSLKIYGIGDVHTNTIENFWSVLKRGIYGIYHQVSKEHIQQYLNEFAYRYNTRKTKDTDRFNSYLSLIEKRLKYKDLIDHDKNN